MVDIDIDKKFPSWTSLGDGRHNTASLIDMEVFSFVMSLVSLENPHYVLVQLTSWVPRVSKRRSGISISNGLEGFFWVTKSPKQSRKSPLKINKSNTRIYFTRFQNLGRFKTGFFHRFLLNLRPSKLKKFSKLKGFHQNIRIFHLNSRKFLIFPHQNERNIA